MHYYYGLLLYYGDSQCGRLCPYPARQCCPVALPVCCYKRGLTAMVYTDGSLNPRHRSGRACFYLLEEAAGRHIRVMDFVSTLNTELVTILQALTHLEHRSCIIVTDSLNVGPCLRMDAPKGPCMGLPVRSLPKDAP